MNSDGLKNCPVCNSTNVLPYFDIVVEDPWERAYVWCRTCRTPGPKCKDWHEQHALWNAVARQELDSASIDEVGEIMADPHEVGLLLAENRELKAANEQLQKHFDRFEAAEINRKLKAETV